VTLLQEGGHLFVRLLVDDNPLDWDVMDRAAHAAAIA
jgi:hypothetical protein